MSASALLHAHHGAPAVPGVVVLEDAPVLCWVCADSTTRAVLRAKWQGAQFTGQNRVRAPASLHVCEPCVWAMSGKPPNTLRMTSHLLDGGEYQRLNKGDKPAILAFLRRTHTRPWFAAVADSGQKHIVPWTPVNPPGARGRALFEETIVTLPTADGWVMLDRMALLLTMGATKAEIETGRYEARAWSLCGPTLAAFEREHAGERGGAWFALAIWLAQRDEAIVAARMAAEKEAKANGKAQRRTARKPADENGRAAARPSRKLPVDGGVPVEALGPAPEPDAQRSQAHGDGGRVGDGDGAGSPAPGVQLGLFGAAHGPERGRARARRDGGVV